MSIHNNDITIPTAFSGTAQLLLYTRYGDPREAGWEHKWISSWHVQEKHPWFPVAFITVHKHFLTVLDSAFSALEDAGLHYEIKSAGKHHHLGLIANSDSVLSVHSWGVAIDLNEADNPIGSMGAWSDEFIAVMEASEIHCGCNWQGHKSPMHFAMVNG
jgi:hypothetical protein